MIVLESMHYTLRVSSRINQNLYVLILMIDQLFEALFYYILKRDPASDEFLIAFDSPFIRSASFEALCGVQQLTLSHPLHDLLEILSAEYEYTLNANMFSEECQSRKCHLI